MSSRLSLLTATVLVGVLAIAAGAETDGTRPAVHPQAGQFQLEHDPDKPLLSFYGGIGLWQTAGGGWTGYGVTSREQVEFLIRRCAENGIKRIYGSFQEEQYPSELTPSPPPGTPDFIALCIELAHQNNIEVYADQPIFAYVLAKNGDFLASHPHVFTRSISGEQDTHMLSAAYPEVRKLKRDIMMEWARNYPIDGLQLDFIRFPYYTLNLRDGFGKHGYDQPLLDAFRALYGYDSNYMPAADDPRWVRMRRETVSQFIRELQADLAAAGIDLPVGVYNSMAFGRIDSSRTVLQDWEVWEQEGLVDEHSPMILMSAGMGNLIRATQSVLEVTRPSSEVIGPIFLAEGFASRPNDAPTPEMVRDAARRLIKAGCDSLWFCRASDIEQYGLWPVVREISEWSISEIRAEDFDPAFENLLADEPEAWTAQRSEGGAAVELAATGDALRVAHDPAGPTTVSQMVEFRPIAHLPVSSLELAADIQTTGSSADRPVTLRYRLHFADGSVEEVTRELTPAAPGSSRCEATTPVKTDFAKLVLERADVQFLLPAGNGVTTLQRIELQRDASLPRSPREALRRIKK